MTQVFSSRFRFPGHTRRVTRELEPIIGPSAAQLKGIASSTRLLGGGLVFACVGFSGWAEATGGGIPGLFAILCGVMFAWVAVVGTRIGRRADKLAHEYVREHLGYDLEGYGSGPSPSGWNRAIERAKRKHSPGF